jgi:endogenous inhibitor of DNA gyrase (YacG/DUF329 family)
MKCHNPNCDKPVPPPSGNHKQPLYCSPRCRNYVSYQTYRKNNSPTQHKIKASKLAGRGEIKVQAKCPRCGKMHEITWSYIKPPTITPRVYCGSCEYHRSNTDYGEPVARII